MLWHFHFNMRETKEQTMNVKQKKKHVCWILNLSFTCVASAELRADGQGDAVSSPGDFGQKQVQSPKSEISCSGPLACNFKH